MIVVGFVSCYREGRLVRAAVESLLEVELDALYLWEGAAGEPLENEEELPASDIEHGAEWSNLLVPHPRSMRADRFVIHRGRWRTDGRKRNEGLQRIKQDWPDGPVWVVVVDADEVLVNGRYLRDRLEWIVARDQVAGASIATPGNPPMARWPLRLVEHEGSMSLITARVFRADLLRSIDHSSSVVTNVAGVRDGWGNYEENAAAWILRWVDATEHGKPVAWPPLPCEPHLVHRSNLRHPLRATLRMSEQEQVEFAAAQEREAAHAQGLGAEVELEQLRRQGLAPDEFR